MTTAKRPRRGGFTLLEVLLASAIGILLLGGLYVAFDMTLSRTELVREEAARADLARAVVNRIQLDLAGTLGPLPPKSGGTAVTAAAGATTETGTATDAAATDAAPTETATDAAPATTTPTETATQTTDMATDPGMAAATAAPIPLGAGVIGTESQLTLFVARVPTALADREAFAQDAASLGGDSRKVTYYIGPEGGLCRQEQPWVTADGVGNSSGPDLSQGTNDQIAPEVVEAAFAYYDGSAWQTAWDGSGPGGDGATLLGPPRAVRITLTLAFPEPGGQERRKTVSQVVAIRAAPAPAPAAMTTADPEAAALEAVP